MIEKRSTYPLSHRDERMASVQSTLDEKTEFLQAHFAKALQYDTTNLVQKENISVQPKVRLDS